MELVVYNANIDRFSVVRLLIEFTVTQIKWDRTDAVSECCEGRPNVQVWTAVTKELCVCLWNIVCIDLVDFCLWRTQRGEDFKLSLTLQLKTERISYFSRTKGIWNAFDLTLYAFVLAWVVLRVVIMILQGARFVNGFLLLQLNWSTMLLIPHLWSTNGSLTGEPMSLT